MSLHNWKNHWQAWLLNINFVPIANVTHDLIGFVWEWNLRDKCAFTANMPVSSASYAYLTEADQFLFVQRLDKAQVFAIESRDTKWRPVAGKVTKTVDLSGMGGAIYFLSRPIIQPDPDGSAWGDTVEDMPADNMIKEFIRHNAVVGEAYDDPNGDPRGITGLSVTANAGEAPAPGEFERAGVLWDVARQLCLDNDIDLTFTPAWNGPDAAVTFEVDTHYGGRGADNAVVLSDVYRVFEESAWHHNKFPLKTHAYTESGHAVVAGNDPASHLRAEMVVDTQGTADLRLALQDARAEQGHTFKFKETQGVQLGVDFWLGDTIAHHDTELSTEIRSELLAGVKITIQKDQLGSEDIELILGDEKPESSQSGSSGGRGRVRPNRRRELAGTPKVNDWGLKGDASIKVGPDTDNAVRVTGINGVSVTEDVAQNKLTVALETWLFFDADSGTGSPDPDDSNTFGIVGGTGISTVILQDPDDHYITINSVWQRTEGSPNYLHQATHGDWFRLYDSGDGLVFEINGDGDVTGNEQAIGSPYRRFSITDYDIIGSGGSGSGIHDINISGDILSDTSTTASLLRWTGGTDGDDQAWFKKVYIVASEDDSIIHGQWLHGFGLALYRGDDLMIYSDTGSTLIFYVDGLNGDTTWGAGATWTIEGATYTLPTGYPAGNGYSWVSTTGGVMSWYDVLGDIITDHGELGGLTDDDHPDYLTAGRHAALASVATTHLARAHVSTDAPASPYEGVLWIDTDEDPEAVLTPADLLLFG